MKVRRWPLMEIMKRSISILGSTAQASLLRHKPHPPLQTLNSCLRTMSGSDPTSFHLYGTNETIKSRKTAEEKAKIGRDWHGEIDHPIWERHQVDLVT